jgi:tripartite-type tricarboxylate transporter receptor subunit TctC
MYLYSGGGPAMKALLSGEVSVLFNNIVASVPQIKAGASARRSNEPPALARRAGCADDRRGGRAGIRSDCVVLHTRARRHSAINREKLNAEFARILAAEYQRASCRFGLEPVSISTEEFARFCARKRSNGIRSLAAAIAVD